MRTHFLAASVLAVFGLSPLTATAGGQDHSNHGASAAKMACCAGHQMTAPAKAKGMACCDESKAAPTTAMACCDGNDPLIASAVLGLAAKPVVQTLAVTFQQPVRVGHFILLGRHVIEHDDARMARGEPCTHIYAADDRRLPVVTFHCTHLERDASDVATVVLAPSEANGIKRLLEFQFVGDEAAHGVPAIR
jgi:hypothetical protein